MTLTCHSKRTLFLLLAIFVLCNGACTRNQTLDQILYKASKNKVYKEIDEAKLASVLENSIAEETKNLANPEFLNNYYKNNGFHAVLIKRYIPDNQLEDLSLYLMSADKHGLSPAV